MNDNQEMCNQIARNIGALVGSTSSTEAISLLNEMMILLFKIQNELTKGGDL